MEHSSVPSCACVTDFASPQRTPILMQLICSLVSPVSTCACVRLSMLLHTLVHARTFFQFRVACDLSNVFSRSDLGRAVSRGCEATPMHRKLNRVRHTFAIAHSQLAMAMHMHTKPVVSTCTGMSSSFVSCPGTVYLRDRTEHKTDARKSQDGGVARDVSVNGVPAFFVAALWKPRNIFRMFRTT